MDYDARGDPPRGEILIRGTGLFQGYYKDKTETESALK